MDEVLELQGPHLREGISLRVHIGLAVLEVIEIDQFPARLDRPRSQGEGGPEMGLGRPVPPLLHLDLTGEDPGDRSQRVRLVDLSQLGQGPPQLARRLGNLGPEQVVERRRRSESDQPLDRRRGPLGVLRRRARPAPPGTSVRVRFPTGPDGQRHRRRDRNQGHADPDDPPPPAMPDRPRSRGLRLGDGTIRGILRATHLPEVGAGRRPPDGRIDPRHRADPIPGVPRPRHVTSSRRGLYNYAT